MENKLEATNVNKIFAMYLGCEVSAVRHYYNERMEYHKGYLTGIQGLEFAEIQFFTEDGMHAEEEPEYRPFDHCKLLLTPLSAISDEHAIGIAKICFKESFPDKVKEDDKYFAVDFGKRQVKNIRDGLHTGSVWFGVFQYLISEGYAVPLWLGINHWANGLTPIELGIAIDSTLNKKP